MNMQNLMQQAQRMQKDIEKKQKELYSQTFAGESEWVKVTLNGKKELLSLDIVYTGDLNEDKEMLADMINIAIKDAHAKIEQELNNKLGVYANMGGLF